MNLPYFAADTLGVTLYLVEGRLTTLEPHSIFFGPWQIEVDISVESDVLSPFELGLWVTINDALRLYLVVRDKENLLFVLNTDALRECGKQSGFAATSVGGRLEEIKTAIRGTFRWHADQWVHVVYDQGSSIGVVHAADYPDQRPSHSS